MNLPPIDYELLPEHIRYGMKEYIEKGHIPGNFLVQVICNRLVHAFGAADSINTERMKDIASFMYNEAPAPCWGSEERMLKWSKERQQELEDDE
jgi:hypothetical protein